MAQCDLQLAWHIPWRGSRWTARRIHGTQCPGMVSSSVASIFRSSVQVITYLAENQSVVTVKEKILCLRSTHHALALYIQPPTSMMFRSEELTDGIFAGDDGMRLSRGSVSVQAEQQNEALCMKVAVGRKARGARKEEREHLHRSTPGQFGFRRGIKARREESHTSTDDAVPYQRTLGWLGRALVMVLCIVHVRRGQRYCN